MRSVEADLPRLSEWAVESRYPGEPEATPENARAALVAGRAVVAAVDDDLRDRGKLIEVALPLEAINRESAREKSIRHGHPSTLHLWWARQTTPGRQYMLLRYLEATEPGIEVLADEKSDPGEALRSFLDAFQIDDGAVAWALHAGHPVTTATEPG